MAHIPYQIYRDWLRLRMLLIDLPVYSMPKGKHTGSIPYSQRTCLFGCACPADLSHAILICPYTAIIFDSLHSPPSSVKDLFDEDLYDQTEVAYCISRLVRKLSRRATLPNNDDQPPRTNIEDGAP